MNLFADAGVTMPFAGSVLLVATWLETAGGKTPSLPTGARKPSLAFLIAPLIFPIAPESSDRAGG